ncbi:S8 family serine peptidase [Wocania ichthyoenteri]|uniref:S8 family serine peptidase n=1 Tax=Wocania ichthyoenteri TaxID=1230531 RepID=UPI0009DDD199|nr:S8 family serine peptidase [Wocania ichthyoenteri]
MIKLKLIICLLCFVNVSLFAQTEEERKKIVESYDFDKINELKAKLKNDFLLRESRIENYLNQTQAKRKYKSKGKTYAIYDIVDGKPIYATTLNINSAKATKTDRLQTGGSLGLNLDGQNMIVGVWDAESALGTHDEFKDDQVIPQSRVVYPELGGGPFIGTVDDHATHVAGTLIAKGADPDAKGMAPKATLRSYDWSDDSTEALAEASNGLLLSNHSYSYGNSNGVNRGAYTSITNTWDNIAYQAPYYLMVAAAANNGLDNFPDAMASGYDQIPGGLGTCKNNLTVANADPFLVGNNVLQFPIHNTSSIGPSDDFRVKPDIAGDGTGVYSPVSVIPSGSSILYDTYIGTSMASPNVTGSLLLLQQYYNQLNSGYMRAASIKALVCHTAKDDISKVGPDPIYGWGLLNVENAVNTIMDDKNGVAVISEQTLNDGGTYIYQFSASASGSISATICWTDPAGPIQTNDLNSTTPRLINDLDLRLEDAGATVFTPWKLDNTNAAAAAIKGDNTVDNIENIDINSGIAGNYTLTVTHKGSLTNGSQAFSLILTGANLTLGTSDKLITNVAVWPNPTDEKLNLSFESSRNKTKISLYDIHGREVYNKNLETISSKINHSIDTKAFYSGIYFLNIQDGNAVYNKKIVIK